MKDTGIVRRMDELGRVVIPKEIRKILRIKEGDTLEIFTEKERLLIKKYLPFSKTETLAKSVADSLQSVTGSAVVICDTESVLAVKGGPFKDLIGQRISDELRKAMDDRRIVSYSAKSAIDLTENKKTADNEVIAPVISEGDVLGAVVICGDISNETEKLASFAAELIARQF